MNEFQTILADSVARLMGHEVDRHLLEAAETGAFPDKLWAALEANGLTRILVPEAMGGTGGTWSDARIVLSAAGKASAPGPIAETLVAGFLLAQAGITPPEGPLTLIEGELTLANGTLSGTAKHVPWARAATHGVAMVSRHGASQVLLVPLGESRAGEADNIAREPRDSLTFGNVAVQAAATALPENALRLYGALARACQMAGALDYLTTQSVAYANERSQFGKPIGKFQAIQQQLAVLSTQAAAAGMAASYGCASADKAGEGHDPAFEIAIAKIRADDAAGIATSIAHQVHGAIGFTYEHALHFATRRLWAWRAEYGAGREWAKWLGAGVIARGADNLWSDVTAR
ncbi:MAG: acyl-CoA dehydrogenase [Rhizobiales bacterium]|nr:acyl-CoA dehydrogenase [Hyphomicrobiales bacterium]